MSIPGTVEALLSPDAPLALRLTGQLLLGVVRIYAYKVAYLHQVCSWKQRRVVLEWGHAWPMRSKRSDEQSNNFDALMIG
jgi:hypothetical protein